jgi:hypothetical protein
LYTALKFLRLVQARLAPFVCKYNEDNCFKMKNDSKVGSFQAFR